MATTEKEVANGPRTWRDIWWQRGIFYQLNIRSFQDSDGNGSGDLAGILERLDYLEWLGADVLWLSPCYPSPLVESGYDISDFEHVHPLFGSLKTFDHLLKEAHQRGMHVILDIVPNHSSDQHPWFIESRASRKSPRRDWYIWADPGPDGGPPNNWPSVFGGSSWTLDETTGQYYYHSFLPQQPDLNWRNPAVREALFGAMHFWLKRGVDGFRLDAIWHLYEDEELRDNPENPDYKPRKDAPDNAVIPRFTRDRPEMHAELAAMRQLVEEYEDRVLTGELYLPVDRMMVYYGVEQPELHLPFNLQMTFIPWTPDDVGDYIDQYTAALPPGAWPTWTIGTHDGARVATRIGEAQARVAAMLLLTLPGTPTIYYGDEIGMSNVEIPKERIEDPQATAWPGHGREPARTPMRWTSERGAGFTTGEPWLPLGEGFNVAQCLDDPHSILHLYRRLIVLRRDEPVLVAGSYQKVDSTDALLVYRRAGGERQLLVVLNMTKRAQQLKNIGEGFHGRILVSTHMDRDEELTGRVKVRANEGLIIELLPV